MQWERDRGERSQRTNGRRNPVDDGSLQGLANAEAPPSYGDKTRTVVRSGVLRRRVCLPLQVL